MKAEARPRPGADNPRTARGLLRRAPVSRADAEFLLGMLLDRPRHELFLDPRPLPAPTAARFERWCRRVRAGEPPQYVAGRAPFLDFEVRVDRRVLIPRPETEELVLRALQDCPAPSRVLDYGTGSGCIAIAVARFCPAARVLAVDSSASALAVARINTRTLGLGRRVRLARTRQPEDCVPGRRDQRFDLVISNPPYIPTHRLGRLARRVRDHEPRAALDGGPDGASILTMLLDRGPDLLAPGGLMALEMDHSHAAALVARAPGGRLERDLGGRDRYLFLSRPKSESPHREDPR